MDGDWEYRPYHLIYTHSCGNSIYLGDLSSASNLNFLHSQHITTVVTAALGMDQLDYSQMSLKHILYPLLDAKRTTASQTFSHFYEIIEKQIKEGNLLVHCTAGVSRSPTLAISYFMKKENWKFEQAIAFVRSKGRKVMPTLGFQRQLKAYEAFLKHSSPSGQERKIQTRVGSQNRWKSSKMRFTQQQLPNLTIFPLPLHSASLKLPPSAVSSVFATLISRREAATQQLRRNRIFSTELKNDTIVSRKGKRPLLGQSSSQANNFQVRRALISRRTSKAGSRSKPILLSP